MPCCQFDCALHCTDSGVWLAGRRLLFENAQQSLQAIQSLPGYQHMLLQPFSHKEVQEYMCVALDRHDITDQIAAAVHERTGGLPLYVEQVTPPPDLAACHPTTSMLQWYALYLQGADQDLCIAAVAFDICDLCYLAILSSVPSYLVLACVVLSNEKTVFHY